ncbi:MAG: MBL fold metallo-hydrolase [Polyangiaceae bacterium]|nr:MBL fold metallo-hydrolase [Polyangiaceae bacterium]
MTTILPIFDPVTSTLTYVVFDPETRDAVVIDPVLDFDPVGSFTDTLRLAELEGFLRARELRVRYVFETHAHADHLSGAQRLKRRFGAKIAIGARITEVQQEFQRLLDLPPSFRADGGQFDHLLCDGERVLAGSIAVDVIATPGHTPACVSLLIGDAVFTGDAVFLEDQGTGRCDFPRGSADELYTSVHERLYGLPDETRVFVGHDYQPNGREQRFETTIGRLKRENVQLRAGTSRDEFVRLREARDATLAAPRLLYQSVQVNLDAGRLPPADAHGVRRLRVPVNLSRPTDDDGTPLDVKHVT